MMQVKFLSFVLSGGAEEWKGRSMREAHKHLTLTEEHFGAIAEHLEATLKVCACVWPGSTDPAMQGCAVTT